MSYIALFLMTQSDDPEDKKLMKDLAEALEPFQKKYSREKLAEALDAMAALVRL